MPTTTYKTLRRYEGGSLAEIGEVEANGSDQAIRKQLAADGFVLKDGEHLVAIPVGNWTERGATVKTSVTFELTDPGRSNSSSGVAVEDEQKSLIDDALA